MQFPGQRDNIHSLQDAHKVVLDHIRETMDPSRRNIVVSHAYIVGAALSESDRAAMKGLAPAVSYDVFQGFDYVALGHIHGPQQVGPNACYSGSPVKYSFSEENQEKGVVLINTEDMSRAFVTLPLLRDRKTVRGTFAELMARTDLADHYLRLRVTDRYSGLETYACPMLRGEVGVSQRFLHAVLDFLGRLRQPHGPERFRNLFRLLPAGGLALLGVDRLEHSGYCFHLASGNDRENVPVKVDGAAGSKLGGSFTMRPRW